MDTSESNSFVIDGRGNVFIGDDVELDNPIITYHKLQNLIYDLSDNELELK